MKSLTRFDNPYRLDRINSLLLFFTPHKLEFLSSEFSRYYYRSTAYIKVYNFPHYPTLYLNRPLTTLCTNRSETKPTVGEEDSMVSLYILYISVSCFVPFRLVR